VSVDQAAGRLLAALTSVTSFVASAVFLISLLLFMGPESLQTSFRFTPLWAGRPNLGQALQGFATNTRRFLAVTAIFGAVTRAAEAVLLWLLNIPRTFAVGATGLHLQLHSLCGVCHRAHPSSPASTLGR
jgi:predicted PurR-regulated permease PerM